MFPNFRRNLWGRREFQIFGTNYLNVWLPKLTWLTLGISRLSLYWLPGTILVTLNLKVSFIKDAFIEFLLLQISTQRLLVNLLAFTFTLLDLLKVYRTVIHSCYIGNEVLFFADALSYLKIFFFFFIHHNIHIYKLY